MSESVHSVADTLFELFETIKEPGPTEDFVLETDDGDHAVGVTVTKDGERRVFEAVELFMSDEGSAPIQGGDFKTGNILARFELAPDATGTWETGLVKTPWGKAVSDALIARVREIAKSADSVN